ncbi:YgfZ/GcvT domain-containing protein [Ferrimonas lipolytica]|uniref:Folate-binding protein YgfZ n=1 Tax=Ferrimonas lipolytica TaxID=2724191 RepID=A0A6H1UEB9_9GAMM|nr:folate-binding protein YgfZ [Ferrimonas lipolytica]QIZ77431.1 folate-binding protein YgfZ [Ferrimonas lipolytica]
MIPTQLVPLPSMGVIRATGADRKTYLQSQLTCDLVKLPIGQWSFAGHCDPKGKMIAAFRLAHLADEILMLMPTSLLQADLPALNKYAVFNKIDLLDATESLQRFALIGDDALAPLANWSGDANLRHSGDAIALIDEGRAVVVLPAGQALPEELAQLPQGEQNDFIASELLAVRPWFEAQHSGEFVPQMVNLDAIGGIQYDKGCYIGQETIARMHFRGGNKRALYVLATSVDATGELQLQLGDNWRRAGTIIASVISGERQLLTVVMNKELPEQPQFQLGEHSATLLERPYPLFGQ